MTIEVGDYVVGGGNLEDLDWGQVHEIDGQLWVAWEGAAVRTRISAGDKGLTAYGTREAAREEHDSRRCGFEARARAGRDRHSHEAS